ncbi:MAG: hypothetical protein WCL28_04995 [bacterium]
MRLNKGVYILAVLAAVSLAANACGKKKDESKDSEGVTASNIADLKLSSSLKLSLPAGIAKAAGQASSINLGDITTAKKSSEACRTIQNVAMMFDTLGQVSGMMCHLEAESAQIQFGKKYKVILQEAEGSMEMPIWIDNSEAGKLTMYTCRAGKIDQKISINSSNSNGASGSLVYKGSEGSQSWQNSLTFDFTTAGVKILSGQNVFTNGSDNNYSQDNSLEFRDSGVSIMKSASKGQQDAQNTFQDRGVVKHDGTMGQALFKGQGSFSGETYNWGTRSTFDQDGYKVANSSATSDITGTASELPSFLADNFSIPDATGWDCSTEETITVDMVNGSTAAAHAACERSQGSNYSCWDQDDFEQGEQESIGK